MSYKHFSLDAKENKIAYLGFVNANQSLNVLEEEALLELNDILSHLGSQKAFKGLVFYSLKDDQFIAGADIADIQKLVGDGDNAHRRVKEGASRMQAVFQKLSELSFPTVCAIDGSCLGGGLELALACDYRVLSSAENTKLGFPEVQLGLLPGAGGTQRCPRLVGIMTALDLMTTGKRIPAKKALSMGLADAVVGRKQLLSIAESFLFPKKRISKKHSTPILKRVMLLLLEGNPLGRKIIYKKAKQKIEKQTKGFYPAPIYVLKAVMEGYRLPLNLGLKKEAEYFARLALTHESKALIHLFYATTHIKKTPYASLKQDHSDLKEDSDQDHEIAHDLKDNHETHAVTLIGGGFMGAGIATLCASRRITSILSDPSSKALGKAMRYAYEYFRKRTKRRRMKPYEASQSLSRISPSLDSTGFEKTDVVIEAVYEDVELKRRILQDLEKRAPKDWVFASNTSAIPIADIAKVSQRKERIVGMHFFSPAEKMPLCEVIRTAESSHEAIHRVVRLGQKLGKQVIVVKDGPGFYTTRALAFYLAEAISLLEEGAKVEQVDALMTGFGFPVGPFTLLDEVGIDVGSHVLDTMIEAFPGRLKKSVHIQKLLDEKRLGRKTAKGIYLYEKKGKNKNKEASSTDGLKLKKAGVDPRIYEIFGGPKSLKTPSSTQIRERLSLIFVNESARCLDSGVLDHPYDGDVGAVFGLGFPPFLGGPFHFIDTSGAKRVLDNLKQLQKNYGIRFDPAESIEKHAQDNTKYYSP
ncbi:MAG: 3-hydroxyacyl-CoA dehydrogenase NAD-binding domain-containing protein [Proteobacteria bacterium]|nr:3-hydroxyacyl-CoA dehydrogenase NAD-binding domain-containing protein [Pseudomonadota bacterium]